MCNISHCHSGHIEREFRELEDRVIEHMAPLKIIVLLGSTRAGRQCQRVADFIRKILEESGDCTVEVLGNRMECYLSPVEVKLS